MIDFLFLPFLQPIAPYVCICCPAFVSFMSEIIIGQIAAKHNGNRNARVQAWIVNYRDIALIAIVSGIKYNNAIWKDPHH